MTALQTIAARTPLHHWHTRHGARFAQRDGWLVVDSYAGSHEELGTAQRGLVIADLSAHAKMSLLGQEVAAAGEILLGPGKVVEPLRVQHFDAPCTGLACRLARDHLLLLANVIDPFVLLGLHAQAGGDRGVVRQDVTSAFAGFGLAGPGIEQLLSSLTALDPRAFSPGSCAETNLAGVHGVLLRPPEGNRLQVYVAWDLGEYVWERLMHTGRLNHITPIRLAAWEALAAGSDREGPPRV
jgi:glycine cleavage system aminomethyltransferase T